MLLASSIPEIKKWISIYMPHLYNRLKEMLLSFITYVYRLIRGNKSNTDPVLPLTSYNIGLMTDTNIKGEVSFTINNTRMADDLLEYIISSKNKNESSFIKKEAGLSIYSSKNGDVLASLSDIIFYVPVDMNDDKTSVIKCYLHDSLNIRIDKCDGVSTYHVCEKSNNITNCIQLSDICKYYHSIYTHELVSENKTYYRCIKFKDMISDQYFLSLKYIQITCGDLIYEQVMSMMSKLKQLMINTNEKYANYLIFMCNTSICY